MAMSDQGTDVVEKKLKKGLQVQCVSCDYEEEQQM